MLCLKLFKSQSTSWIDVCFHCTFFQVQGVHKVFRQFKKFIDITTDPLEMSEMFK